MIEFNILQTTSDVIAFLASIAVFVASYRRSRCLSRYPVWRSVLIGLMSSIFALLWLIVWWVNRRRIAAEWKMYREARAARHSAADV